MRTVTVLGSTGSIGENTLAVLAQHEDSFRVAGLTAGARWERLVEQARRWRPQVVALSDPAAATQAEAALDGAGCRVLAGPEGVAEVAGLGADIVVNAVVGVAGLVPTIRALEARSRLALANKESMVAGGPVVIQAARQWRATILPVDSEPSAVFQCLLGQDRSAVRRVILTSSGGPFWRRRHEDLSLVTPAEAVAHPRWKMGRKISVDSATLVNKGLELIEAHWLFGLPLDAIDVLIHPEAIIHSLVEFVDGSILAQLGVTDMRLPIQFALTYPRRLPGPAGRLDLLSAGPLTLEPPDEGRFPGLPCAREAGTIGGTMPAVMNAANEVAVDLFLSGKLPFTGIPRLIRRTMDAHRPDAAPDLSAILAADDWARRRARDLGEAGSLFTGR